jgi:uncharacterized protein
MTTIQERFDGIDTMLCEIGATRQYGSMLLNLGAAFGGRFSYAQGGLLARVVDMPADASVARGVTIKGGDAQLDGELDRLQVLPALGDGLRWSLLEGGAALVLITQDGAELTEQLNPGTLVSIDEIRVVAMGDIRPGDAKYTDPRQLNFGKPTTYRIRWAGNAEFVIHESRVIEIPGGPIPAANVNTTGVPWAGRGLSTRAVQAIERYRRALGWAERLLERSQQAVHGMQGLAEMLMQGPTGEAVVRKRIDLVDSNRSAINGVAVDGGDTYTITSAPTTGVPGVLAELQVAVSAETGIPVTILFGRSPGGLNATGDSDWAGFFDLCAQLQGKRLTPALERIVSLIYAQKGVTFDNVPDDWEIEWNPLAVLTEQQRAELEDKKADTVKKTTEAMKVAVVDGAFLSQDEATEYLRTSRMFGLAPEDEGSDQGNATRYAAQT